MADEKNDRRQHDFNRTINYYALLIGVIACANFWIYWLQGSRLTLGLAIVCLVCLVVWMIVARRLLRPPG